MRVMDELRSKFTSSAIQFCIQFFKLLTLLVVLISSKPNIRVLIAVVWGVDFF